MTSATWSSRFVSGSAEETFAERMVVEVEASGEAEDVEAPVLDVPLRIVAVPHAPIVAAISAATKANRVRRFSLMIK